MKYTLLELTQRILESMDSDEIDSISDTIESTAVSNIIKETYWYLVTNLDLPAVDGMFQMTPSGDNTKPCLMKLPSNVVNIDYLKYKKVESGKSDFLPLMYIPLEDFLERTLGLDETSTNVSTMVVSVDGSNFTFKFYNDRNPEFYTTLDDVTFVFNGYDSSVDSTLQGAKTLGYGKKIPTFTMEDSFLPKLDPEQFQLLLNESKTQAFAELKQSENSFSQNRARKTFIHNQKNKYKVPGPYSAHARRDPNYGRK